MKNSSFWNKIAGAKGKAVICTAAAALAVMLLFMVCSNNSGTGPTPPPPPPSSNGYCRLFADPTQCPEIGGGNQFATDEPTCVASGGAVVTACNVALTAGECQTYPTVAGCAGSDQCNTANPAPTCQNYCQVFPTAAQCTNPDPCTANPTLPQCGTEDPCVTNPTPNCANYCQVYPNAAECGSVDPCVTNPTFGCPGYCDTHASDPLCQPDNPCAGGASMACCAAQPTYPDCEDDNPCAGGATTACCNAQPTYPGCNTVVGPCDDGLPTAACCAAMPSYPGCSGGDTKYCRWNNSSSECYPIDASSDTPTEQSCREATGEVVSSCDAVSTLEYCRWDGVCYPLPADPNTPCDATHGACTGTARAHCAAYGEGAPGAKVYPSLTACEAYVQTGPEYYCYWTDPTAGCFKISDPNAINPDPANNGMTEKEVCEAYSLAKQVFTTADCDGYTPPAVTYYCDWGPFCSTCTGDDRKGCWPTTQGDAACAQWGTEVECHKGNAPANGEGSCCAQ